MRDRIDAVEDVANDLFTEWERELGQYSSNDLRRQSAAQLRAAQDRYRELIGRMRTVESRLDPVLRAFNDQVLFLKHNLNARAVASLDQEELTIRTDVERLIREIEASIAEADAFIDQMRAAGDGR